MGHILRRETRRLHEAGFSLSVLKLRWFRHLSELKFDAVTMTSSLFCTSTGIFLHPGDLSNL